MPQIVSRYAGSLALSLIFSRMRRTNTVIELVSTALSHGRGEGRLELVAHHGKKVAFVLVLVG